jgi:hypothetical protein
MATMSSVGERTLQNSARPHSARTLGAERSAHLVVLAQDGRDDDDATEEGKSMHRETGSPSHGDLPTSIQGQAVHCIVL